MMDSNTKTYLTKHPTEDYYIAIIDGERGYFMLSEETRHSKAFADDWNARFGHTEKDILDAVVRSMRED